MTKVRYALALILLFIPLVVQAQLDPPDTPQNVKVTVGNAKLTLTWQAPSTWGSGSARGYQVDWYSGPAAPVHTSAEWQRVVYDRQFEASATETSFTFSGNVFSRVHNGRNWIRGHHTVANGNQYHLRLRAGSTKPGDPTDILVGNWVTVGGTPQAVLSTNADLGGLTASSATSSTGMFQALTVTPSTFNAATTEYTASVANARTHVKLTPTVNETNATVKVGKGSTLSPVTSGMASGAIALDVGANAITVRVTAQDGTTMKDYTVTVTRAAAQQTRSANANLGALTAGSSTSSGGQYTDFSIGTFGATTTTYTASVANDQTHVKLTPTVADTGKATVGVRKGTSGNFTPVTSGSASSAIALDVGSNTLVVRVTAEDGSTTKDYTVTVTRALAAPTGLRVTAGDGKLDLSWTAPSGTLTGYDVHYTSAPASGAGSVTNSAAVQTVSAAAGWLAVSRSGTDDFQTISGLANDQAYRVRVRAKNASGAGAWVFGTGTPRAQAADPAVTLSASPNPVTEGSSVTVTATLSAAASSQVTIPVTITDNSAEPEDHGTLTGITIASGATSGTGTITTNQDADDQDETFTVALGTLPSGVTAGSVTSVQVRIRDDEGVPAVTLSASPNPVTEGSSVTVTATLSAAASSSVTIPVTITDNSAEPEDHGTLTGITIASGATGGTGTIATNQDTDTEDETFTVALGALPSAVAAGSPGSVQIRIADDDRSGGGGGGGGAPDLVPGFGTATVADQSYIEGTQIPALMLPEATGGDGALTYRLAPEPPSGLVLNAGTRTLTGTPDTAQGPVRYTWTARDADGDEAPLSFTIAVAVPTAPAAPSSLTLEADPAAPAEGGDDVTVTARLDAPAPSSGVAVTLSLSGTASGSGDDADYTLSPTMIEIAAGKTEGTAVIAVIDDAADDDGETIVIDASSASPALTAETLELVIADNDEPDLTPSFGDATVAGQSYVQGTAITALALPAPAGGDGVLTYSLTPEPPSGLSLDEDTRTLTGTPDTAQGPVRYTWTARDADGDEASLSFTITVAADLMPSFGDETVAGQSYVQGTAIAALALPAAAGGDGALTYRLTPEPPSGLVLDAAARMLTGTPGAAQDAAEYTWTVRDADGDEASLSFTITVVADLMPSFGGATVAGQSYVQGTAIAALTLPAATGGDGVLTYSLTPAPPSGLSLDEDTRTLSGTPDAAQDAARYTWTARDADGDEASLTFSIEVEEDLMPSFGDATVAGQSYVQGTAIAVLVLPAATGGDGALTYTLTPEPPSGLSLDEDTRTVSGTPDSAQDAARYTWTARDADGDEASLSFTIAVAADPRRADVKEAVRQALAAAARRAMAGALDNIGARFGDIGASGLSLAGQWVPLEGAGAGVAAAEDGGLRRCASAGSVAGGAGSLSGCAPGSSRGVPARALLGASAFSLHAGSDGSSVSDRALWSVWGRGDLGTFEGRGAAGVSYDGELRTGWLGVDARSGPWVAGLAVSRGTGEADYGIAGDGLSGRLETELTSVHPYGRWKLGDGLELRGVLGGGTGDARHEPDGGDAQTGDLSMRMASVGVRHALSGSGGVSLALRADGSVVRMETGDGPEVIHGLSADGWRLRAGLEASTRLSFSGDASLEPFFEASARRDGGDGLEGSGVELAGGLRWVAPGVSVEMRGRWLAAHSAAGAEEAGASLTARAGPGSDGRGLFLSLSPRWGAASGGARALWNEEMPQPSGSGHEGAVEARVGYGFGLPGAGGVVTPFAEAGLSGGDGRRLRVGTRFGVPRASFGAELSGAVDGRGSGPPSHAVRLELQLRF